VFASDIDTKCQDVYERNFRLRPVGDICAVRSEDVPDHDVLCGGFPCQPFSTAGHREAFDDTRGTLFQEIARIVRDKKPKVLLLENVKGIKNIQGGHVYRVILGVFESLGYTVKDVVLSPDMFGVPQRRERVYFIGIRNDLGVATLPPLPTKTPCTVLDTSVDSTYRIAPELRSVFSAWDEMIPVLAGTTALLLIHGASTGRWSEALLAALALALAVLPNEIPVVLALFLALGAVRLGRIGVLARWPAAVARRLPRPATAGQPWRPEVVRSCPG
jgi:hypothetical protein